MGPMNELQDRSTHFFVLFVCALMNSPAAMNQDFIGCVLILLSQKHLLHVLEYCCITEQGGEEREPWIRQKSQESYTDIPHLIALHKYCMFYKLKVSGNPASGKSVSTTFPTPFAHSVSACHVLVILTFQTFPLLSYLL